MTVFGHAVEFVLMPLVLKATVADEHLPAHRGAAAQAGAVGDLLLLFHEFGGEIPHRAEKVENPFLRIGQENARLVFHLQFLEFCQSGHDVFQHGFQAIGLVEDLGDLMQNLVFLRPAADFPLRVRNIGSFHTGIVHLHHLSFQVDGIKLLECGRYRF